MILSLLFAVSVIGLNPLDKIVAIQGKNIKGNTSIGTGFLIDSTHIMTAAHVVDPLGGYAYKVACLNDDVEVLAITEVVIDPIKDLALVTVEKPCSDKEPLKIAAINENYGNTVYAIGCPYGYQRRGVSLFNQFRHRN